MKQAASPINDFVAAGMQAIETHFANRNKDHLESVITIPTPIYENLLRNVLKKVPLFTGKINGDNRPIRYDPVTKLLHSKEDGRLIIHMGLIEEQLKQRSGLMSNMGAEITRQARAGNPNGPLFKYDANLNYLGVEVNGKIMGPDELHQIHDSKICNVCEKPSNSKCSACKAVNYCSPDCQKLDWHTHKVECHKIKALRTMMQ